MTMSLPRALFRVDPLIAEAKRRAWRRRLAALAGSLVVAGVLVAWLTAGGLPAPAGAATVLHDFPGSASGMQIVAVGPGFCGDASWMEDRPNAWKCAPANDAWPAGTVRVSPAWSVTNYAGSACFAATAHARTVVCPLTPWSRRAVELRLTRPLGSWRTRHEALWVKSQERWAHLPWGVWTKNGERCITQTGQMGAFDPAGTATYACADGSLLVGFPRRSGATWTIGFQPSRWRRATRVAITDVWR
jgi:hypothetical protein